jgi:hypothetical protein
LDGLDKGGTNMARATTIRAKRAHFVHNDNGRPMLVVWSEGDEALKLVFENDECFANFLMDAQHIGRSIRIESDAHRATAGEGEKGKRK